MSALKNTDWFEEIDYTPDNVICEVLEVLLEEVSVQYWREYI